MTLYHGPEPEHEGLTNWRNLHYFEYNDQIRIWDENDADFLLGRNELYIRKVDSEHSKKLLLLLDEVNLSS